jgi:hypothetical protein
MKVFSYKEWCVAPPFLISKLDGDEWSASGPGRFTPGEISPGTIWVRGCVGPTTGLDAVGKRKIYSCLESNSRSPAHSPSLYWLGYPGSKHHMTANYLLQ